MKFAEYAKMYMALAGLLAAGALGVTGIPVGWKVPLALVVAAAGAFGVWKVENVDPPVTGLPGPGKEVTPGADSAPAGDDTYDGGAVLNLVDYRRRVEPPAYKLAA
jgi:hypothetical protein